VCWKHGYSCCCLQDARVKTNFNHASNTLHFEDCGHQREPKAHGSNQVTSSHSGQSFDFAAHVTAVCMACNYHILWALRLNTLACNIVVARIYYRNSILYGASTSSITKLQRLHNSLVYVVMQQPRRTHAVTSPAARRTSFGWPTSWPFLRSTCDSRRHRRTWTVSSLTV